MILEMMQVQNVNCCMKLQLKMCQVAPVPVAYLDKHSTLDPVMVSVMSSIPTEGNLLLKLSEIP